MGDVKMKNLLKEKLKVLNAEAAYILKPEVFSEEYDLLLSSFKRYYDNVNIAYSFKTNYIPDFLDIVKRKRGYAEVVSIMELDLALKVGFLPEEIFFNGPFKHRVATLDYLKRGVLVNVDSFDEFVWIEKYANDCRVKCRIGLRLNFNFAQDKSRFGIDTGDINISEILSRVQSSEYLLLESLHFHYASRKISAWRNCADRFITFLSKLDSTTCEGIRFISLGGGMFSRMDEYLESQIEFDIPSFDEYSENSIKYLATYLAAHGGLSHANPEILIEPGTALASKAVDFVAEVVSIKAVGEQTYINTTGSKYNMNPSPNRINSPLRVLHGGSQTTTSVSGGRLCGYTCIESDILHDDYNGDISVGDLVIFKEVGAYSVVMKPPFILPDVPIIQYSKESHRFETVRDGQGFENIFGSFRFFSR